METGIALSWPFVSVVILNYNGKEFLDRCLDTVFKTNYPNFEIILVDNGSVDGSIEFIQSKFGSRSNFSIIRNKSNLGFAEGNNIGARAARGEYVVFLNNDTEVHENWLRELIVVMRSDEKIGVAQSKLLLFDHETIDSTGDFINFYGCGWMRGCGEKDKGQFDRVDEIFSARGAAMIAKKEILKKVGYFDPTFFMICEDVDLCWRVRLNGNKIVFVPKSIVYHFGSGTRKSFQYREESYYLNSRNSLIMLIKNFNMRNLLMAVIVKVAVELTMFLASIPFLPEKRYNLARLRAILWVLLNLRHIWRERLKVQYSIRKVPDEQIKKFMIKGNSPFLSIVWNLFYKDKVDYNHFLNENVFFKNRWIS